MKDFFSAEKLHGDNKYECNRCKAYTNATKTIKLEEEPLNLIVNLKKFDKFGAKIKSGLDYPNQFSLNDYIPTSSSRKGKAKRNLVYELYAVINHEGSSSHKGHYTCYVKGYDEKWYVCDDSTVKRINGNNLKSSNKAYILFYKLSESSRKQREAERRTSNVSTDDSLSDTKSSNSTKPKSLTKINRKRARLTKSTKLNAKLPTPNQSVRKRDRKSRIKVIKTWELSELSDCTSCDSKRFKAEEQEIMDNYTEISIEI